MKATFFSIAALAAGALATPVVNSVVRPSAPSASDLASELQILQQLNKQASAAAAAQPTNPAGDALHILDDDIVDEPGVGQVVDAASGKKPQSKRDEKKTTISSIPELISKLNSTVQDVSSHTDAIGSLLKKVQAGDLSKKSGTAQVTRQFSLLHFKLSDLVAELTSAAGLPVAKGDTDKVLTLLTQLLNELLATVKSVVKVLGVSPALTSILHSVFNLVSELLTLVIGLVSEIVPGLVAALTPLLAGLGNGLLAPILGGVAGLLTSLTGA